MGGSKDMKLKKGILIVAVILCLALTGIFIYLQRTPQVDANQTQEFTVSESENFIKQNFTDMIILDMDSAIDAVSDYFNLTNTNVNFRPQSESSMFGDNFFRLAKYYKDIPVWGRNVVVLVREDGTRPQLSGDYIDLTGISATFTLSERDVIAIAKELFGEHLHTCSLGLVIYSQGVAPILCYKIDIIGLADDDLPARTLFICANTGKLVSSRGQISETRNYSTIRAVGQDGHIEGGAFYDLPFYKIDDEAIMFCSQRNIAVYSFSFDNARRDLMMLVDMLPNGFNANEVIRIYEDAQRNNRSAVDAFGNAIVVYDFFANNLERRQFNNNPNTHLSLVVDILTSASVRNAFFWMYPGLDGVIGFEMPGSMMFDTQLSVNLDVVAHEFVHGVCRSTWVLPRDFSDDEREAAAIFEAIADIFGEIIEHYHTGHNDWKMAGFGYDYIRNIYDGQDLEFNTQEGSHYNSRVISWIARVIEHSFPFTDREQLINYAQLWHGVQSSMRSIPTFQCFANYTINYAHHMLNSGQITDTQFQAIQNAFEQNGITPSIVLEDIGNLGSGAVAGVDATFIREVYMEFLHQRAFQPYVDEWGWWTEPVTEYAIIDINGDGIPELLINSSDSFGFYNTWIFSYDLAQERIVFISEIYRFGVLSHSREYRALVYQPWRGNAHERIFVFNIPYILGSGGDGFSLTIAEGMHSINYEIYTITEGQNISEEEFLRYMDGLIEIAFSTIPGYEHLSTITPVDIQPLIGTSFNEVRHVFGNLTETGVDGYWGDPYYVFENGLRVLTFDGNINEFQINYHNMANRSAFNYRGIDGRAINIDVREILGDPISSTDSLFWVVWAGGDVRLLYAFGTQENLEFGGAIIIAFDYFGRVVSIERSSQPISWN